MPSGENHVAIGANVRKIIDQDPRLSLSDLDVTVSPQTTILKGTAPNLFQKKLAGHLAEKVQGVSAVENKLTIASGIQHTPQQLIRDARNTLTAAEGVDESQIFIECTDSQITLNGTVRSDKERADAETAIEIVHGVKEIINNIAVALGPPRPDDIITGNIRLAILKKEHLGRSEIEVSAERGIVTVKGSVWTIEERREIEEIVRRTEGVTEVINLIRVID